MTARFVPWTGAAPAQDTGGSAPVTGSPRFTPFSGSLLQGYQPQGGTSGSTGGGPDINAGLLGSLSGNLGGILGGLGNYFGSSNLGGLGQGFQGLGGLFGLAQGIQSGNPRSIISGLGSGYGSTASALNQFAGTNLPSLSDLGSNALSGLGLVGEAAPSAGALGELGINTALGSAGDLAGTALDFGGTAGLGLTTAMLLPIIESFFGKDFSLPFSGGGRGPAQLAETTGIRKDFGTAWPVLSGAGTTQARFQGLNSLSPADQIKALQGIGQEGGYQLDQIPAVSQYISTQGGRQSGSNGSITIPALDVSGVEKTSGQRYADAYLNSLLSNALLQQRGVALPSDANGGFTGTTYRNPMGELGPAGVLYQLAQQAGVDPNQFLSQPHDVWNMETGTTDRPMGAPAYQLTPQQSQGLTDPSQMVATLQSIFGGLNPQFGQSYLGQQLGKVAPLFPSTGSPRFTPLGAGA